jgi:hypothetical protein
LKGSFLKWNGDGGESCCIERFEGGISITTYILQRFTGTATTMMYRQSSVSGAKEHNGSYHLYIILVPYPRTVSYSTQPGVIMRQESRIVSKGGVKGRYTIVFGIKHDRTQNQSKISKPLRCLITQITSCHIRLELLAHFVP